MRDDSPEWAIIGFAFVPVYSVLALAAYASQITILPRLAALVESGADPAARVLLAEMAQGWTGSIIWVLNNLAYAVLGVPSILFGAILARRGGPMRLGAILLAISGAASLIGIVGIAVMSPALELGSLVGGALFLLALIPVTLALLREG